MKNLSFVLIIIILLFVVIAFFNYRKYESFNDFNPNLVGYEEGLPIQQKTLDYQTIKRPSYNLKEFNANNWHLRLPDLVAQRYSYNDKCYGQCGDKKIHDYANLKELPLNLRNFYYATVPLEFAATSSEYYPDYSNKKYEGHEYLSTACQQCRNKGNPTFVDASLTDIKYSGKDCQCFGYNKPISGYDYSQVENVTTNTGPGTSDNYHSKEKYSRY